MFAPCKGFWILESKTLEKFFWWNPESWALESGIQLKESGAQLTIGIRTPSSSYKEQNPVPGIRPVHESVHDVESRIQDRVVFSYMGKIQLQKYTDSRGQGLTRGDSNAN